MSTKVFTGRYQIVRKIARGGMAEVYLAQDLLLERQVALKVLFPEFSNDISFVERFRREARAAANLNHPGIVSIYDWGEEDGTYFIVMEYVDGATLRDVINSDGPLPADEAAHIGAEIAGALHYAHASGVVHRDVKPGNVILSRGQVKVTDFGIARGGDPAESLTQTGAVMGTATYFSPEQAQGQLVDPRSDVYSLGVVLYEMVTKRPPFTGDSPLSIAYQHVREHPTAPSDHNPDVPPLFDALVFKAMAKDRNDRHADADELREDLVAFREGRLYDSRSQPVASFAPPPLDTTLIGSAVVGAEATSVQTVVSGAGRGPGPNPPARSRTGTYIVVLATLLAVLAGLLFLLSRELGGGSDGGATGQVAVPGVVNLNETDARTAIEKAGLKVGEVAKQEGDGPTGQVTGQNPPEDSKVERGSAVGLTVRVQSQRALVPDVVKKTIDEATTLLEAAGFVVVSTPEASSAARVDTVLRQSPAAGAEIRRGETVNLAVSTGPEQARIPEVRNREASDAAFTLGQAGFRTSQRTESSADVAAGKVIRTDPGTGTPLAKGSIVAIVVSSGPVTTTTTEATTTTTSTTSTTTVPDTTVTTKNKS